MAKKLSVSIPDDLWQQFESRSPDNLGPSHLVQEALRRIVAEGTVEPAFAADRPFDLEPDFQALALRFAGEAKVEFDRGYRVGIWCARGLAWGDIEDLAERFRFDLRRWAAARRSFAEETAFGSATPIDLDDPVEAERLKEGLRRPQPRGPPDELVNPPASVMDALIGTLGNLASPFDSVAWLPSPTYLRGVTEALRDLWRDVLSGRPPADQEGAGA